MGIKISGFRQTPRCMGFSPTRFLLKSHLNGMRCLGPGTTMQFSPKILGLGAGIFRIVSDSPRLDFWGCFGQSKN